MTEMWSVFDNVAIHLRIRSFRDSLGEGGWRSGADSPNVELAIFREWWNHHTSHALDTQAPVFVEAQCGIPTE